MRWTKALDAGLAFASGLGLSASQIAKSLGGSMTRYSIIGRSHRIGVELSDQVNQSRRANSMRKTKPQPPRQTKPKVKPERTARFRPVAPIEIAPSPSITPAEIYIPPIEQRRSLMQLTNHTCKYPYDDAGGKLYFCGAAVVQDKSWCEHHCGVVFVNWKSAKTSS